MRRLTLLAASLFLAVGLLAPTSAQAQSSFKIGPRIGIPLGDVSDRGGNFFFGADARVYNDALPVVISPSFDYYLLDDQSVNGQSAGQTVIAVDINALYEFGIDNEAFVPYAGGGLAITRWSQEDVTFGNVTYDGGSSTEVGLNIVGGARFPLGTVDPFVQLNATLGGDVQRLGLAGGLLFNI